MKLWIVSEASKCDTDPRGSCQKGPVGHPGTTASPHQRGRGLHLLMALQGNLGITLEGQVLTLPPGTFHDNKLGADHTV